MTHRLVIGTNNPGKLREFRELLDGCGFELVTPRELGVNFDPEETGGTYAENATMKAVEAARACGASRRSPTIPGWKSITWAAARASFSARYAGGDRTDPNISEARQLELLLEEMKGVPDEQRTARFRCAIAIATPAGEVQLVDGVFEGRIGHEVRGTHGFGYDPIFVLPERGVTSAGAAAGREEPHQPPRTGGGKGARAAKEDVR